MKLYLTIFFTVLCCKVFTQTCTTPGQQPTTAFPVCGTSAFTQTTVPICGGTPMPSPACKGDGLRDLNPFFYKFTCFKAGSLGFTITPNNLSDDYDWELYDVTGRNPNDIYTDGTLVIASNWSGESGQTGASAAGTSLLICGGYGLPLYSKMPALQVGHNYILLISHFTRTQSGYSLAFDKGDAVITDSSKPKLKSVDASCGGDVLTLSISKKIKCSSISTDGSEFYITPAAANVANSTGIDCSSQFDTDSLQLKLSSFLAPGNYTLHIKKGSDNNTLLDYCDNDVSITDEVSFNILPKAPTPIDSITPVACAPRQLHLILSKPILCSSIAADGSDFTVTGNYPVTVNSASGNCNAGSTKEIIINLTMPLQQAGTFTIAVSKGSDGNTLINECGQETPVGSSVSFTVKDTVNAAFTYSIKYGCAKDTVQFFNASNNGVNNWQWNLDDNIKSNNQNPTAVYSVFNQKKITLLVSNGFCTDSSSQNILLDNYLKAAFAVFEDNCPLEPVIFTDSSVGKIVGYTWDFGDGGTAIIASPTHVYNAPFRQTTYNVNYIVTDSFGCASTASKKINVYPSCYLAVPTAFTPNGDGLNDTFHPLNAIKANDLQFRVYNRWGQLVFKTTDWKKGWDGSVKGIKQATGTFVWMLTYTDRDTQQLVQQKGTVLLIR